MIRAFLKKMLIPSAQTQEVLAVQSWTVRWTSRHGKYNADTRPEAEVFINEPDAIAFKKSLENAFKLIRHTSGTDVTLEKNIHNGLSIEE